MPIKISVFHFALSYVFYTFYYTLLQKQKQLSNKNNIKLVSLKLIAKLNCIMFFSI